MNTRTRNRTYRGTVEGSLAGSSTSQRTDPHLNWHGLYAMTPLALLVLLLVLGVVVWIFTTLQITGTKKGQTPDPCKREARCKPGPGDGWFNENRQKARDPRHSNTRVSQWWRHHEMESSGCLRKEYSTCLKSITSTRSCQEPTTESTLKSIPFVVMMADLVERTKRTRNSCTRGTRTA